MRRTRRSGKNTTPLDDKQKALIEQQEKLRQKMDRLQRLIEEAPKLAEEQEKRRREEMARASRSSRHSRRSNVPVLHDKRYEHTMHVSTSATRPSRKTLKAEKQAALLKFFALSILLAMVLLWLNHVRQ